jgi:hypothetical protein
VHSLRLTNVRRHDRAGPNHPRKIRRRLLLSAPLAALLAAAGCAAEPQLLSDEEVCTAPAAAAALPDTLRRASGVAISRTHPGVLWVVNNTEDVARVFAVDTTARVLGRVEVPGARNLDWESIAVAPCDAGQCLYIAEIGDNLHVREEVGFYRVPEPAPGDRLTEAAEWFPVTYPEGPQDAEALFVLPGEQVFIITKGRNRAVTLYRYPPPLRAGVRVELELLQDLSDGVVQLPDMVTGADATYDGRVIAVRSYARAQLYTFDGERLRPLLDDGGLDLRPLGEPQGEGIAIRDDGWIVLVGERGVNARHAPLATFACRLDRLDAEEAPDGGA